MILFTPLNAISVFENAFYISNVITSIFCSTSITPVAMIDSDAAIELVASLRKIYAR